MFNHLKKRIHQYKKPAVSPSQGEDILFAALEQNMMAAVLIDEQDRVMFYNRAAEKLWGYRRDDVLGQSVSILIPHDLKAAHPGFIRHHREGGDSRVEGMSRELQLERKDGERIWTRFSLSRVVNAGKVCYLALARDATLEVEQREQTRLLLLAVDHISKPVIVLDTGRRIVQANRAFTEAFGLSLSEAAGKRLDSALNIPDDPPDNRQRLQNLLRKNEREQNEFQALASTGENVWFNATLSPVLAKNGQLQNLVMTFSDITEDRKIRELERALLSAMRSNLPIAEMGEIICRNIVAVLGQAHASLKTLQNNVPQHWASSAEKLDSPGVMSRAVTIRRRDGVAAGILAIDTVAGKENRALTERVADISQHLAALVLEQENSRQQIEHLIKFDPLTGLPNRSHLQEHLDQQLATAETKAPVVLMMTVDHFQDVIDAQGYSAAEQLLSIVANRLRNSLGTGQYLSKIEGQQFVLVDSENDVSSMTRVAEVLENAVSEPINFNNTTFSLTLSIGISYEAGKDRDWLLSTAHSAMDHIYRSGGNGWQFFNQEFNRAARERLLLGASLKRAVAENRLRLVYQPQINIATGELYGLEALARWWDPEHGDVPPARFIPLAEEVGEIENIGIWVLREACRQLAQWRKNWPDFPALSVNLSAIHFHNIQLPTQVLDAINEFAIPGEMLTLEITESMVMAPDDELSARFQTLRDMGVGLSVDDFGTGFSGLSRLVTLPVTEIKIDKSFVDSCLTDNRSRSLLEAITGIGQSFGMTVVAEGVETREQLQLLRHIGCPVVQGYYFSRPIPPEEVPEWFLTTFPGLIAQETQP